MTGVSLEFNMKAKKRFQEKLDQMVGLDTSGLLDELTVTIESQTRDRLANDKEAPDGSAWAEWSEDYKATRHDGHSLLESEGNLIDSIDSFVDGDSSYVGSPLVYAARRQFGYDEGGVDDPGRPFLGLSAVNLVELEDAMSDFMLRAIES